ncbi:unnamed protein product, partial [Pylaiella littoralis]
RGGSSSYRCCLLGLPLRALIAEGCQRGGERHHFGIGCTRDKPVQAFGWEQGHIGATSFTVWEGPAWRVGIETANRDCTFWSCLLVDRLYCYSVDGVMMPSEGKINRLKYFRGKRENHTSVLF